MTATLHPNLGKIFPPEQNLARGIISALDRDEDAHIIGFSRGALITHSLSKQSRIIIIE